MSSLFSLAARPLLAKQLLLTCHKRFNTREAIHRYVEPPKFKKHMLAACEPYFKRDYTPNEQKCKPSNRKVDKLHPLEVILSKELVQDIEESDFILIFQYNYTPFQSERVYKNTIIHSGGKFHSLNNDIYKEAFRILNLDQKAINLLEFCRHGLVTGKLENLTKCVTVFKKMPHLVLLCTLLERQLLTVDKINKICAYPTLDQSRANLVGILETPAINLAQYLNQHKEELSKLEQ